MSFFGTKILAQNVAIKCFNFITQLSQSAFQCESVIQSFSVLSVCVLLEMANGKKAGCKMLVKFTTGVNCVNILRRN